MHGRRSLSVDLKEFDPEIERTLKGLRVQGKITNNFDIKMAEHPRALREYFTPNTYNSPIGTSRQIGNRGMYEVSQNVDLSLKVDALSKKFDQLLALNTLPTNSPNGQGVCAICSSPSHAIYNCPSASLFPEFVQEQVNAAQGFHRQNDPYSNTYVPPHPPQSGNSIFEEKVLSALKGLEVKIQILDSHTQSIAKLETQIGQLANAISRRDEGRLLVIQ
ncbi:hypothetical protein M9H77_14005 [Catharanthus roseus]|uniref:Uncharacterized protein n=1 Tax=Catharanthus roseus TaxID=4058 RepID=A0ACC0BLY9_CATRO|nr:hypothetical protein M9H77_14005 [Catharanthus roseus]